MSHLDLPLDCVRKSFAESDVIRALALLHKGLWEQTETRRELLALIREVGDRLAAEGATEEAEFCAEFGRRVDALDGRGIEFDWFLAEILWVTGWAKPSPKRIVDQYLDIIERAQAMVEARSSLPHRLSLTVRHSAPRPAPRGTGMERVGRIAMAIGSLGVSEVWRDAK